MLKKFCCSLLMLAFAVIFSWLPVRAGEVKSVAGGSGAKSDYKAIKKELEETGYVKLVPGETYDLGSKVLHVKSNWTIEATGATIKGKSCILLNVPECTGYSAIQNFRINGGTWVSSSPWGVKKSAIKISHGQNISFTNMTMRWCNLNYHSIELVGCKNVTISNCNIDGLGKGGRKSVEEAIQIDLAAPLTALFLKNYNAWGLNLWNGAPCENILIKNCYVRGCRGICANFASKDAKSGRKGYLRQFHKNIVITGNTIIGAKSEGLAMFNVLGSTVSNNTIISRKKKKSSTYSIGCHYCLMGKIPPLYRKFTVNIIGNRIGGGRNALSFNSHSKSGYDQVIIKNNKLYCKRGAHRAFSATKVGTIRAWGNYVTKW